MYKRLSGSFSFGKDVFFMSKKRKTLSEFRKANSKEGSGHPTYIYARVGNEYMFLGLTHSDVTKGTKNIRLEKNPNPKDKRPAYVRPVSQKAHKASFGAKLKGWFFGDEDKEKIDKLKK